MTVTEQVAIAPSVFVVDDEPEMRLLARVFLERGGFNVVDEAEDGPQALERFNDLNPPPIPRSSSSTTGCRASPDSRWRSRCCRSTPTR